MEEPILIVDDEESIADEPWHYRYVGREAAEIIEAEGLCLEEYLERIGKGSR